MCEREKSRNGKEDLVKVFHMIKDEKELRCVRGNVLWQESKNGVDVEKRRLTKRKIKNTRIH